MCGSVPSPLILGSEMHAPVPEVEADERNGVRTLFNDRMAGSVISILPFT